MGCVLIDDGAVGREVNGFWTSVQNEARPIIEAKRRKEAFDKEFAAYKKSAAAADAMAAPAVMTASAAAPKSGL
jgi:hypothetical protein